MQQTTAPSKPEPQTQKQTVKHHYFRTFFAGFFGFISLNLILFSILVVWLSATLTSTDQYVKTVTPIASSKVVQDFVVSKVSSMILDNSEIPLDGLAENVLTEDQRTGKSNEELRIQIEPMIKESLTQIIASPTFSKLWVDTNRSVHAALVDGINTPSGDVQLDLNPLVKGVVGELGATKFGFIQDKIELPADAGAIKIESSRLDNARHIYDYFKKARLALWACAVLSGAVSVLLSVHHLKTLRRIALFTGIFTGIDAILLSSTSLLKNIKGGAEEKALAIKLIDIILHDLRLVFIVVSVVTLTLAIGSKIIAVVLSKRNPKPKVV